MSEWISVKERLPELDQRVIATDRKYFTGEMTYSSNKFAKKPKPRFEWQGMVNFPWTITDWMPLPEPPKGEREDETGLL